jgi:hypothetical protein
MKRYHHARSITGLEGQRFNPGDEQLFKIAVIHSREALNHIHIFEIENEEKESGFPDSLEMFEGFDARLGEVYLSPSQLIEYKVSDQNGDIKFQKRQPLFYKRNSKLCILVRAWSVPECKGYEFNAADIIKALVARVKSGGSANKLSIVEGILL